MKTKLIIVFSLLWLLVSTAYTQNFNEVLKVVAPDRAAYDLFGYSVDISGNFAIVGSFQESEDAEGGNTLLYSGSAYIFERDASGNWTEVQKIVAPDRAEGDNFGFSVSISGNYILVGAIDEDEDAAGGNTIDCAGSAYIFERDGSGNWNEVQKIVAPDRAADDEFGNSVSISGNYAIIGAERENEDVEGGHTLEWAGSAYIFERDVSGNWNETQKIVAPDRAYFDFFGGSVSISGNYVLVGAQYEDEDASGGNTLDWAGSAYIFKRDGSGNWNDVKKIVAPDRASNDVFGGSVSISGNYVIVGAKYEDENSGGVNTLHDAGSAYIFERDGSGNWNEKQKIVAPDRAAEDIFGNSVSISGNYVIVGAQYEDEDASGGHTVLSSGSAYIFERDGSGNWNETQKIVASDRAADDQFGSSVSISDNYALVGAYAEEEDAEGGNTLNFAGSTYIFESCSPGSDPDPQNILENGNFNACILSPWSLPIAGTLGVTGNAVLINGACNISGISLPAAPESWYVQLLQNFSAPQLSRLEAGSTYKLSFDAWAENNSRPCNVVFQEYEDPWTPFLDENILINKSPATYSYEFKVTTIFPVMTLTFKLGGETGSVTFDNVSFIKKNTDVFTVPGKIQAEDYKSMSGIDIETTTDAGGGQDVGWIDAGDWMEYQINVPGSRKYTISYRVAGMSAGQVTFAQNGVNLSTTDFPSTGGWQTWTTVKTTVNLAKGIKTIRLTANANNWNINWWSVEEYHATGIEQTTADEIAVFPNPASGNLNINAEEGSTVILYNSLGVLVKEGTIENGRVQMDVSSLTKGIYVVKVNKGNKVAVTKVVLQ
jgi:hypothetical protein